MLDVASRIKTLKRELGELGVKGANVTMNPALSARRIAAREKQYGVRLPDDVKAYYLAADGQTIAWSTADGVATARSRVSNLATFLASRPDGARAQVPFHSKYLSEDEVRALSRFFVFEQMYADSFVLVPADAGAGDTPVYLLQHPNVLTKLDLTFSSYIERLFANKALLNWQEQHKEKDRDPELLASFERAVALVRDRPAPLGVRGASGYQVRLRRLVEAIAADPRLELVRLATFPAPPVNAFKKIEATFGRGLPPAMIEFYSQTNGFKLLWRTRPGTAPEAAGVIDILPLEQAFGGEYHGSLVDWDEYATYQTLWDDELRTTAPADFQALKNKRIFDRHLARNQVLMEVTPGGVEFFYYVDGGVLPLQTQFEQLIELVFDCGGVEYYPDLLRPGGDLEQFVGQFEEKARLVNPGFRAPARRSK